MFFNFSHQNIGILIKDDGVQTTNLKESVELLILTHFQDSVVTSEVHWIHEVNVSSEEDYQTHRQRRNDKIGGQCLASPPLHNQYLIVSIQPYYNGAWNS